MAAPSIGSNGRGLAQEAAPRIDAAERATSSVLALDGWGRIEPEPARSNGVAPPAPPEPQPALWDELAARFATLEAPQISIAPVWRLFGPAALMGLAVGALVGGAMRWWQVYSAPPPPPPPSPPPAPRDPLTELRARVASFQASDEQDIRDRLRVLVAPSPAPPPAPKQRFPQRWQELLEELADRAR